MPTNKIAENPSRTGDEGFKDDREDAGKVISGQPRKATPKLTPTSFDGVEDITDYGPIESGEVNTPRLARGITEGTITAVHAEALSTVTKASGGSVDEPPSPYNAQYPFNSVEESDSGHFREMDDTPGAERIKESHRTGTFYELHPDGSKVTKVVKDNFSVTIGNDYTKIEGVCAIHVAGAAQLQCDSEVTVKSSSSVSIDSGSKVLIDGDTDVDVKGGSVVNVTSDGAMNIKATGILTLQDSTKTESGLISDD